MVEANGFQVCCTDFAIAMQSGTDNEGYGALMYCVNSEWYIGSGLSDISFCPWCGTAVEDNKPA